MKKFTFLMIALFIAAMGFAQNQTLYKIAPSSKAKAIVNLTNTSNTSKDVVRNTRDNANIFSEGFEFSSDALENGWTSVDQDGDGYNWFVYGNEAVGDVVSHSGEYAIASASWRSGAGALTPNNWLISPAIDLTSQTGTIMASYFIKGQDPGWYGEHYKVCVSTSADVASFSTILFEETIPQADWNERSIDLSAYAGQTIYIAFVHYNITNMFYIVLDDFTVYTNQSTDAAVTEITAPNHGNFSTCALTNAEQVKINIINNGGTAISNFEVSYAINDGTPVTETVTTSVAPAQTYEYTFTQTADLSAVGTYEIVASVNLTGDENTNNNNASTTIISGDAMITIHAFTDNGGGQSWTVTNTNTNTLIAERTAPWQWNIEVNDYVCVDNNGCYTVVVTDNNGMVDGAAYLEILYNGTQVAGSTTPDSFTETLTAERLGNGCSTDPEIATDDTEFGFITIIGEASESKTATIRAYNLTEAVTATTTAPFEISTDDETFATSVQLATNGGTLYIRFNPTTVGQQTGTVTLSSTGAQNVTIALTGKAIECTTLETPWEETFNDDSETRLCWSVIDGNDDDSSYVLAEGTEETGIVMLLPYGTDQADYLVSPEMILGNNASVSFKVAHYQYYGTPYPETYEVYVFSGTEQTLVKNATETTTLFPTFETVNVSLADYAGQTVQIAVKCISEDAYYFIVDDFSFTGTVDVNENIANTIAVYPNPTSSMVTIANAEGKDIVVVNALGQVVASIENAAANQTINVANFANGTYFVKVNESVVKINVVK